MTTTHEPVRARHARATTGRAAPRDGWIWVLVVVTGAVHLVLPAMGASFDAGVLKVTSSASDQWQLLDLRLLRGDLLGSLWALHMQPPLYNLLIGLLVRLPEGAQAPVASLLWMGFAMIIAVATYATMVLLAVPRRAAFVVTLLLVVLNPATILYANWLMYAAPTAALVALFGALATRALMRPTVGTMAAFASAGVVLALFNSLFQPVVLLVVLALVVLCLPSARRATLVGSAAPVVVLLLWLLHMTVSFGSPVTSSWLGMNLARTTTLPAPTATITHLVAERTLTPLALERPFESLAILGVPPAHVGPAAETQVTKANGATNLNNRAYLGVAHRYLSNDLAFIAAEPGRYLAVVAKSSTLWFVPSEQYFTLNEMQHGALGHYSRLYEATLGLQPTSDSKAVALAAFRHLGPKPSEVSWATVLVFVVGLLGSPVLIVRWWRRARSRAVALLVLEVIVVTWLASTSLIEFAENNRFRFELSTLPLTLATVVATVALRRAHEVRSGTAGSLAPAQGTP
jgi:hypothetical protein